MNHAQRFAMLAGLGSLVHRFVRCLMRFVRALVFVRRVILQQRGVFVEQLKGRGLQQRAPGLLAIVLTVRFFRSFCQRGHQHSGERLHFAWTQFDFRQALQLLGNHVDGSAGQ